jgi:hypothetical protein
MSQIPPDLPPGLQTEINRYYDTILDALIAEAGDAELIDQNPVTALAMLAGRFLAKMGERERALFIEIVDGAIEAHRDDPAKRS